MDKIHFLDQMIALTEPFNHLNPPPETHENETEQGSLSRLDPASLTM